MEILYIIGNGFDIAQNCNTSYGEFYKYLEKVADPKSRLLKLMLDDIYFKKELNWSDLELALGKFCKKAENKKEFEDFYFYIARKLKEFLQDKDNSFTISDELAEKYAMDVVNPVFYLTNREKLDYSNYFGLYPSSRSISFLTFNYTSILERSLKTLEENSGSLPTSSYSYQFNEYLKIHGSLSTNMLMGLDNKEQIENSLFADDPDIADFFIKPISNFQFGTLVDDQAKIAIEQANLIVTMGVSFGDTDKSWWKYIGRRIASTSNVRVIIYHFQKDISDNQFLKLRLIREVKNRFLEQCELTPEQITAFSSRVNVAINQPFLKPDKDVIGLDRRGY